VKYESRKRAKTLRTRSLDFEDFPKLFEYSTLEWLDDRADYGEVREVVMGFLGDTLVYAVYTLRSDEDGDIHWVISMRKAERHEEKEFFKALDG
jgi:uncharacterized DUF497 family protein